MEWSRLTALSDDQLLASLEACASKHQQSEVALIAHIAEVDRRKLYRQEACSSMHVYCIERLGLSDDMAFKRIRVARAARRYPEILARLAAPPGERIHLTGLARLAVHLTDENAAGLLSRAAGKTVREIERISAELRPRPDVPASVRRLPRRKVSAASAARPPASATAPESPPPSESAPPAEPGPLFAATPSARPRIEPLSPERYKVQFTADQEIHDLLELATDLVSHRVPNRDLPEVMRHVLALAVAELKRQRFAEVARPRKTSSTPPKPGSRYIPAPVRRAVFERDGGRCTFLDRRGRRCSATSLLQFHHHETHARGGPATEENLSLRCGPHNQYQAELDFGADFMAERRGDAARQRR